jgi:predicted nucleic acid-binding protein
MIAATRSAKWKIHTSSHVLDEVVRVMQRLGFTGRLAALTRARIRRRAAMVKPPASRHAVRNDPADSPILRAALACGADYLVTNDRHLLELNPYEAWRSCRWTITSPYWTSTGYWSETSSAPPASVRRIAIRP